MPQYLPQEAMNNNLIDKQPRIRTDPDIIFAENKAVARSPVLLTFDPACNGSNARVWGREPPNPTFSVLTTKRIENGKITVDLADGIYAVDVPDHQLRTGFEVTGGQATKLFSN